MKLFWVRASHCRFDFISNDEVRSARSVNCQVDDMSRPEAMVKLVRPSPLLTGNRGKKVHPRRILNSYLSAYCMHRMDGRERDGMK